MQREGGVIGLRLTGVVAEINMAAWEAKFQDVARRNGVDLLMSEIYVDDQNIVYKLLRKGTRWSNGRLSWRKDWEDQDTIEDEQR